MRKQSYDMHPCLSEATHGKYERIHLPVAPLCNIKCRYCTRKYDCVNESRPGVASRVVSPRDALKRLDAIVNRNSRVRVIGVAGPGDALANPSTFEFFRLVREFYPELSLCVATNGLVLSDYINVLEELEVNTITITINAISAETALQIYSWIYYKENLIREREAVEILLENQWKGLNSAAKKGFTIKINSIVIPGINEREIVTIAEKASSKGANFMNITPVIPNGEFSRIQKPSCEFINELRERCSLFLPQIKHCRQCRADALGGLHEEKDMELELLLSELSYDYCEVV